MNKPKVLVDLCMAHSKLGFRGIQQDSRLLFDGLIQSPNINADGLLWSYQGSWMQRPPVSLREQSVFLTIHLKASSPGVIATRRINRYLGNIWSRMFADNAKSYPVIPLREPLNEIVWRTHFALTLRADRRTSILDSHFFLSTLGWQRVTDGALGHRQKPFLNTKEHDIAIFQDSRAVTLPRRTQKIIRYHDGIPVLAADLSQWPGELHARAVAACERDSVYVCNSTSARNDLEKLSPRAADRAEVIPYFVPEMRRPGFKADLRKLAAVRISQSTLGTKTATEVVNKWFGENPSEIPAYIMTLSTIEPRKNICGLIRAWQQLRDRFKHDVKLMIVGTPAGDVEPILREMRPYVEMGYLLHLEQVGQNELPLVYSGARCFAYLSFIEGFGIPPIEAMQCDCPVLVSDVPAHRYAAGDGAIYCDPYDDDDIAARLNDILVACQNGTINDLLQRGRENAAKYTVDKVLPLWESLLSRLATKPTG